MIKKDSLNIYDKAAAIDPEDRRELIGWARKGKRIIHDCHEGCKGCLFDKSKIISYQEDPYRVVHVCGSTAILYKVTSANADASILNNKHTYALCTLLDCRRPGLGEIVKNHQYIHRYKIQSK